MLRKKKGFKKLSDSPFFSFLDWKKELNLEYKSVSHNSCFIMFFSEGGTDQTSIIFKLHL